MKKELTRLETEVKEKDKEVQSTKEEIAKLQSEKAALTAQVKDLQEYIERVKKDEKAAVKAETITEEEGLQKPEAAASRQGGRGKTPEDQGPVGRRKAGLCESDGATDREVRPQSRDRRPCTPVQFR